MTKPEAAQRLAKSAHARIGRRLLFHRALNERLFSRLALSLALHERQRKYSGKSLPDLREFQNQPIPGLIASLLRLVSTQRLCFNSVRPGGMFEESVHQ